MREVKLSIRAVLGLILVPCGCLAQDNPWNGSWKADPSSLRYEGPTYSVKTEPDGYTVIVDGKAQPKTLCNGAAQDMGGGVTRLCTRTSNGYVLESTKDGKVVRRATLTNMPGGPVTSRKVEMFPADGPPVSTLDTSKKLPGGNGATTLWKETSFTESADTGILTIHIAGNQVEFKETDVKEPDKLTLDGTEKRISDFETMALKQVDAHTLKETFKNNDGSLRQENTFVLSPDGKSIRETDVSKARSSTMTIVLRKM